MLHLIAPEQLDRFVVALDRVAWSGLCHGMVYEPMPAHRGACCPVCRGLHEMIVGGEGAQLGHHDDCDLAKLIAWLDLAVGRRREPFATQQVYSDGSTPRGRKP